MRIVTVCRSGGEYTWHHVNDLRKQCERFAPGVPFVCLSDDERGAPLQHNWPGWWSKMEIFTLPGPCLYFDLDTVIVDSLSPLIRQAKWCDFTIMRDVYKERRVQSSVMAWSGDMRWLYEKFAADPERHMTENSTPQFHGDQGFIGRFDDGFTRWQDVLPGALVSWKRNCSKGVPDGARVVVFHGRPRPWQVEDQWRHMTV